MINHLGVTVLFSILFVDESQDLAKLTVDTIVLLKPLEINTCEGCKCVGGLTGFSPGPLYPRGCD